MPEPPPLTFEPTDGVVFAFRLMPNWLVPWLLAVWLASAVIVFSPDVSVAPLTVIEYPLAALVAADMVDVPEPVVEVVSVPRATVADPRVNVSVSSTLAVTVI